MSRFFRKFKLGYSYKDVHYTYNRSYNTYVECHFMHLSMSQKVLHDLDDPAWIIWDSKEKKVMLECRYFKDGTQHDYFPFGSDKPTTIERFRNGKIRSIEIENSGFIGIFYKEWNIYGKLIFERGNIGCSKKDVYEKSFDKHGKLLKYEEFERTTHEVGEFSLYRGYRKYQGYKKHYYKRRKNGVTREFKDGKKVEESWYKHGNLHRNRDKPAMVRYKNGFKVYEGWFKNGQSERNNAPAKISYHENGTPKQQEWYKNNKLHNDDGPAMIKFISTGQKIDEEFFFDGEKIENQISLQKQHEDIRYQNKYLKIQHPDGTVYFAEVKNYWKRNM